MGIKIKRLGAPGSGHLFLIFRPARWPTMPAGFDSRPVDPGAVGTVAKNTVRMKIILNGLICPITPVKTEIIKTFEFIF